jgi:PAS domain S-box-containing protein
MGNSRRRRAHPHAVLGEIVEDLAAEIESLRQRLAAVELPVEAPDELALTETVRALEDAHERLRFARTALGVEKDQLRALLEDEHIRYRDLFELAPDAYLVTGESGTILEANTTAERLFGMSRDLLIDRPLVAFVAEHDRRALRVMLGRIPRLDAVADWEVALTRRDGSTFPAAVTVARARGRGAEAMSLTWLIRDITERKRMEDEALSTAIELERRVQERTAMLEAANEGRETAFAELEAVVRQIPAAIVLFDSSSGEITPANEEAERLLAEVAGKTRLTLSEWLSYGTRGDGQPYAIGERPLARAVASGRVVIGSQIEYERADGRRSIFELSAAPVRNSEGEVVAAVAAYWDVTDRERRVRAERDFVTNAAHELRTPLAALASSVDVLQSGAKENPETRDRFLRHVEEQCGRLQRLVQSMLLLARAQTGQETRPEPIGVGAFLDEIASEVASGRLRVQLECPPQTSVLANRELLSQALRNLISNAVKYAPDGDIVLKGRERNGFVSLEVIDSGPGIGPDDQQRVVERFYRGRESRAAEGFGLGLSIASQVAEAMSGKLEIESEGGAGTRVRLMLPRAWDA